MYSIGRMLLVLIENIDQLEVDQSLRPTEKWRRTTFNGQKCEHYQNFVDRLLVRNPLARMRPEEALVHPFLNAGFDEPVGRAIARHAGP